MQNVKRLAVGLLPHRLVMIQTACLLVGAFAVFTAQASAVIRFQDRSLFIKSSLPGATTQYKVSLTYNNQGVYTTTVGSIDLLFCLDPVPSGPITPYNPVDHHPCVAPTGLDVSHATLSAQSGEAGFTILSQTTNEIILSRPPASVAETPSTYIFDNIVNPVDTSHSFAIRLSDYPTVDATGTLINLGSVLSQATDGVVLETQVPGILVFCVAGQVNDNCIGTSGINYTDMGTLDPTKTLMATSQMGAGTNASGGYSIVTYGTTMQAGTHVISALTTPTQSAPGNSQFGINLVANTAPLLGLDPAGSANNTHIDANYAIPNEFMFHDGDEVASAPNVSFVKKYTVSYIVNSPPDIRPGVYTTSLTFLCTGRF